VISHTLIGSNKDANSIMPHCRVTKCLHRHLKAGKLDLLGVFDLTNNTALVAAAMAQEGARSAQGIVVAVTPATGQELSPDVVNAAAKLCPWIEAAALVTEGNGAAGASVAVWKSAGLVPNP
jgi:hypothetical protein